MMHGNYENSWAELNSRLRQIEISGGGLDGALRELETHQKESGFIKADLGAVKRISYSPPENSSRFFRIQYNPERALRFNGSGFSSPPPGTSVRNGGCFLCRDNIRWQQQGTEMGYEINMGETGYYAWMNPFPLLPTHVVIATREHTSQDWPVSEKGNLDVSGLLHDLIELAWRMPGFIGFYNGVNAGASIPSHLHFQFFKRPREETEFPLESAARRHLESGEEGILVKDYPLAGALKSMAESGLGISWITGMLARIGIREGSLVQPGDDSWCIPVEIRIFRSRGHLPPAAENFWQSVVSAEEAS